MIAEISRRKAKAIETYIKYLPGVYSAGDRWFCDWLDETRSHSISRDTARIFQLGLYTGKGGSYEDLIKILDKFGIFPSPSNPTFNYESAKLQAGRAHIVSLPINDRYRDLTFIPDNLSQAFQAGLALIEKYKDFSFPMDENDVKWLNMILEKFNKLLIDTAYDMKAELCKLSFLTYTSFLQDGYLVLTSESPCSEFVNFAPNQYLNNIFQLHKIARAIGADTSYHMHTGSVNGCGIQSLLLVNEKQTV